MQTAHAALEFERQHPGKFQDHPHFVVCAVTEQELNSLKTIDLPQVSFYEEDLGGQLTSVAIGPVSEEQRKQFRNFKLLTFPMETKAVS